MGRRILVIEDDPAICRLLERGLRLAGFEVTVASDVESGGRAWLGGQPDLVVVDVMLPDGDGLELVAGRRRDQDRRPVIVLTAREDDDLRSRAASAGADFVAKPFAYPELLRRIGEALGS